MFVCPHHWRPSSWPSTHKIFFIPLLSIWTRKFFSSTLYATNNLLCQESSLDPSVVERKNDVRLHRNVLGSRLVSDWRRLRQPPDTGTSLAAPEAMISSIRCPLCARPDDAATWKQGGGPRSHSYPSPRGVDLCPGPVTHARTLPPILDAGDEILSQEGRDSIMRRAKIHPSFTMRRSHYSTPLCIWIQTVDVWVYRGCVCWCPYPCWRPGATLRRRVETPGEQSSILLPQRTEGERKTKARG